MLTNNLGQTILEDQDIFDMLYQNIPLQPDNVVQESKDILQLEEYLGIKFTRPNSCSIDKFDSEYQNKWFMPIEYQNLNIEKYIIELAAPWDPEHQRVIEELAEYKTRNLLDLLRWLKYFVDTARNNNIVWGVGRGSSVASYVLFLLGVHKIDSIKYNLDWREFLR